MPGNFESVYVCDTVCYVSERSAQFVGQPQVSDRAKRAPYVLIEGWVQKQPSKGL